MPSMIAKSMEQKMTKCRQAIRMILFPKGLGADTLIFIAVIILANLHLLPGMSSSFGVFRLENVRAGEWWLLLTHPFVHVSVYHLALDAGAFLLLYPSLEERHLPVKLLYVIVCGIFSLGAALMISPVVYSRGLCGLSRNCTWPYRGFRPGID